MATPEVSSALRVIIHAAKKRKRGKNPSLAYRGERNPKKALARAILDYEWEQKIPYISDELLAERMKQIKWVRPAMSGVNGKPYLTDEQDEKYFDLFYVKSFAHPRNQAFNFDEKAKLTHKAVGLKKILVKDIFIRIGGYYGFCKISFAEVLSQIPSEICSKVVAFSLNPATNPALLNEDYQSDSIIFYSQGEEEALPEESLPSVAELIKPVDIDKANKLKDQIKPMIKWAKESHVSFNPEKIDEPFMNIGIWLKINGSHLLKNNEIAPVVGPFTLGKEVTVYQEFQDEADFFAPSYAYTISQIPDELITENTIGLVYGTVDYFRAKEGMLHKATYILAEKVDLK